MAFFESKQRRLFKVIKSMADSGNVDQAATKVEQDLKVLLETPELARELVAFLMDIGYPDLSARAGEEIIRLHRDLATPVLRLLEDRQADFPRSFELLRTLWQIKLRQRDYTGALELLNRVDRSAETKLFEALEAGARSAERFAADKLLEGDIDRFVGWSLAQFRKGRVQESLDTLLRAAQKTARADERIPSVVDWISTRKGDERDPLGVLYLVRVYLAFENAELALRNLPDLFDAPPEIISQTLAVVEKDLIPLDLTNKSRIYFVRLLSSAERFDDASRELERLFDEGDRTLDFEAALRDMVSRASANARPHLLMARFKKDRGENTSALDSLEKAFACEDAAASPIGEIAAGFLDESLDRDGIISRKLADFMVERGTVSDAVEALCRLVHRDPEWVMVQVQKLLQKDKNSAEVLTLLAVTMQVKGRESEASATMQHLQDRKDRKSREDIVQVLSRFDGLMDQFPGLRRMRASVRGVAGREGEAASDWFSLLLSGETVPERGLEEIREANLHIRRADELLSSGFEPGTPQEALLGAVAALSREQYATADQWLIKACSDAVLAPAVAGQVSILPDSALANLSLDVLLPIFADTGAAKTAADIILRTSGSEIWRMDLVSRLTWSDPPAEILFRLRAFLAEGKLALAGDAIGNADVKDSALTGLAGFCRSVSAGDLAGGLVQLEPVVEDRRTGGLASGVLEMMLDNPGQNEAAIRMFLARASATNGRFSEACAWLEPVLSSQGVTELLEHLAKASPGMVDAPMMLVRSAAQSGDFDRLRRFSSMVLEMDAGKAVEIASICETRGNERGSGQCLAYAAELSDRYQLQMDPDSLLIKAVLADPGQADVALQRKGGGPALKAICAIANGNASSFTDTMRRRQGLTIPLSRILADKVMSAWQAGRDDEALSHLAGVLASNDMNDLEMEVMGRLACDGIGAWRTSAAERLLTETLEGRMQRTKFWSFVRDHSVIEKAIEGPLGVDLRNGKAAPAEVSAAAGAVLASGLEVDRLLGFGEMLMGMGGEGTMLKDIALAGYEKWKDGPSSTAPSQDLVKLLVSAGMLAEATEAAWSGMDNRMLGLLRQGLLQRRASAEGSGVGVARDLITSGKPSEAFEALKGCEGPEASDLAALALWKLGRRNAAIAAWAEAFRRTGDDTLLLRLHWALGEAGYASDRSALEQYVGSRHASLVPKLGGTAVSGGRLCTISTA